MEFLMLNLLSTLVGSNNSTSIAEQNPSPVTETYITSSNNQCKINNPYPQTNETVTWSGDCVNGFADGYGTVQWYQDGEKVQVGVGTFRHGKQTGKGTHSYTDGGIYKGNWVDDKKHGKGKYTWANGSFYQGNWQEDKKYGYGILTLVKGDEVISYWEQDNLGHWQGDRYIVQGIFKGNNLVLQCNDEIDCKK